MTGRHTEKECSGKRKKTNIFKVELNEPGFWWKYYDEMSKMLKCAFYSGEESVLILKEMFILRKIYLITIITRRCGQQNKENNHIKLNVMSNKVLRFY